MTAGFTTAIASFYDPGAGGINGHYGGGAWTGHPVEKDTNGFAHKTMRFGTVVEFRYNGRSVMSTCVDRGPFVAGRDFDLLPVPADALGMHGVAAIEYRVAGTTISGGIGGTGTANVGKTQGALSAILGTNIGLGITVHDVTDVPGVNTILGGASAALHTVTDVRSFLSKLAVIFSANFWLRVLMAVGGVFLIGLGITMAGKNFVGGEIIKTVKGAVK